MTPAKRAKQLGLKSLKEAEEICGKSPRTLYDWFHDSPLAFEAMIKGCVKIKQERENERLKSKL